MNYLNNMLVFTIISLLSAKVYGMEEGNSQINIELAREEPNILIIKKIKRVEVKNPILLKLLTSQDVPAVLNQIVESHQALHIMSANGGTDFDIPSKENKQKIFESIIKCLQSQGATINDSGVKGRGALHWAMCQQGRIEYVQSLLACGADPYQKDEDKNTPLMLAQQAEREDLVSLFTELELIRTRQQEQRDRGPFFNTFN